MGNYAYLICVQASNMETGDDANNNKYYEMKEQGDGTFLATYARVGAPKPQTKIYPISKWDQVYRQKTQKVRNGYVYKDITHLRAETKGGGFTDIKDGRIQSLLNTLQSYSNKSVSNNYTVSSESVTQAQVDEAQRLVDLISYDIIKAKNINQVNCQKVNNNLLELYQVIPRKMKKVSDYLIQTDWSLNRIQSLVSNEQSTLDVMAQQVNLHLQSKSDKQITLEDALGIRISHIDDSDKNEILNLMGNEKNKYRSAWRVVNIKSSTSFDDFRKNKAVKPWVKLLWHGSRNENWLNILKTSLMVRPAGVVLTGAMFGNGIYFADKSRKSIGYTSLRGSYWASGSSNKAYLALFAVNTGMELRCQQHQHWMYDLSEHNLKKKGQYDSLFAQGGIDLINNEYIVYNPAQCTIKYLVEIGS